MNSTQTKGIQSTFSDCKETNMRIFIIARAVCGLDHMAHLSKTLWIFQKEMCDLESVV